jgi:hypothetical protein
MLLLAVVFMLQPEHDGAKITSSNSSESHPNFENPTNLNPQAKDLKSTH